MIKEGKINAIKRDLHEFAALVEHMIERSIKGLISKDKALLTAVIEEDEVKANSFETTIEELCTVFIAQFQPQAKNLRTMLMILKMNNDLERVADHAVNISESSLFLIERPQIKPYVDLPKMAETVIEMLNDSIHGFINEDGVLARSVCRRDEIADDLKDKILNDLIAIMTRDPSVIERSVHLIRIVRNLERVADLSTNLCEDVVFMVEGKVIRHQIA
ncbi:MAG: phosphate signaling complex protein PhoU [Deltaproteobacteria bacterium]|nr:phosphate signaling complex protein PhoU [Deltaproteobacteria bacterium]